MSTITPPSRIAGRRALLHSVSATALLASAAALPGAARAGSFRSINQALAQGPAANAAFNINTATAKAAKQAALGAQNVATAAARFRSLAQALAGMSYTGAPVPDGIAAGGLQQAPGVAGSNGTTLWSGASSTLTQTISGGVTDVTVTQTAPVASLTWRTYNIGQHTKLIYNQSAGGTLASSWVAINTIQDPLENPTTILGQISAPGKVFILNPNGVLFGAGSQLNLGGLVASTALIAQSQLSRDANGLVNGFALYGAVSGNTVAPTFIDASTTGSVIVAPGASITTTAPAGTQLGGYVMLLADTVRNGGEIVTPSGQTVLAAGTSFSLAPGYSVSNPTSTVVGSEIAVSNAATGTALGTLGTATNSGIILADQGDVTMVGHAVEQAGVILATTTVDTRGTVHLLTDTSDPTATVDLAANSITEVLPEDNGQTALESQRAANLSSSITDNELRLNQATPLNDLNRLPDTLGESRIEISTGGSVTMAAGAMALAQGGQVEIGAGQSVAVAGGATIDVSGANAVLPASADTLGIIGIVGYYLRDTAGNRSGPLEFKNAFIDLRTVTEITSGAYAGNIYNQAGLLELSGNIANIPHGIEEWSALGGQVSLLSGASSNGTLTGGTVTVASGATINLTGGTVTYQAGDLPQSYVQATTGQIFNINDAPGDLVYTGLYVGQVAAHPRWNITQTFANPLLTPAEIYQPSYTIGRDAGSLTVAAAAGSIAGNIDAGVTTGDAQTAARPTGITDPFLLGQSVAPLAGALTEGIYHGGSQYGTVIGSLFDTDILITGSAPLPPNVIAALPDTAAGTISIAADALNAGGLASIVLYTSGGIALGAPVQAADGGTVTLGAPVIEADAGITAHGGAIALTNLLPQLGGGAPAPIAATPGNIVLGAGAVLDASGAWVNLARDPAPAGGQGFYAGGSITVTGTGPVDLEAGAVLDVSSGGVLSQAGKLTAENGGGITLSADIVPLQAATEEATGPVTLDATLRGYASGGGGTLSIQAPAFLLGGGTPTLPDTVAVDDSLFATGFADYVLNGDTGLTVTAGAQIAVTRPVYLLSNPLLPTGADAAGAFSVFTPALYTQVAGRDVITQRAGASLSLASSVDAGLFDGGGGGVSIGAGASLTVDPRQSITVEGYGQVTVLGTLTAHGGTIGVLNTRFEEDTTQGTHSFMANDQDGLSVWIGDGATLDASGQAEVMRDAQGLRFGQGQAGGTILLGGAGGLDANSVVSSYAQVIVRPGALLDAAGAAASVDIVPGTEEGGAIVRSAVPVVLSGAGGTIDARSYFGVALDGTMLAQGAGPGAAGGTLEMRLDAETLNAFYGLPGTFYQPSQILISQDAVAVQPGAGLAPGDPYGFATLRLGRISQQQITAAGFDALNLYAQDQIVFEGSVDLSLGRALVLSTTVLGEAAPGASATVHVPYLSLFGYSNGANGGRDVNGLPSLNPEPATGTLTLDADFIDVTNALTLGGERIVGSPDPSPTGTPQSPYTSFSFGFANAVLESAGDIRFNAASNPLSGVTSLISTGDMTLQGAQLYPAAEAVAVVTAGEDATQKAGVNPLSGGTLTILGQGGAAPQAPYSVGGTLSLFADTVDQEGVVRAPEGVINLGETRGDNAIQPFTDSVVLAPGSVTSVSLAGQTVPFGGTVDGVNYLFAGQAPPTFTPLVRIASAAIDVQTGAEVDLSGGGTLSGAAFIAGRGGSADVNLTPLLRTASGTVSTGGADQVFAILPGTQSAYAPVSPGDSGYAAPSEGAQVSIGAGEVPGLAAGTYTLLPAYYDLLPGAYRVELTTTPMPAGTSGPFGNFTTEAAVTLGTANTGIAGATPIEALITSGAGVRQLSQYNEESYNDFEAAQAATFGAPRPLLPQDAKTLLLNVNTPDAVPDGDLPVSIGAASLLQAPAAGGYGATLEITANNPLEIVGPGDAVVPLPTVSRSGVVTVEPGFGLDADMLSALDMPRLVIGGTLSASATTPGIEDIQGVAPVVLVAPHAALTAGDLLLTADGSGQITVTGGAVLSTIGAPATAYGQAQGITFDSDSGAASGGGNPVLSLSNVQVVFAANTLSAFGASITVDAGATLAAGGSLDFVAPQGSAVQIGEASLRAQDVTLQVADINIGSTQALADFAPILPQGLALDAASLNTLAQGSAQLSLTAEEAVNIIGSVALDSGSTSLVLNTPAIYGYGIAGTGGAASDAGVISITAPRFTWGAVSAQSPLPTGSTTVSANGGGQLAGSVVTGAGTETLTEATSLTIDATSSSAPGTLVLGYGPATQTDDQATLGRLAAGFDTVTLAATGEITANNQSALSVFATQTAYGQPGTGGDLILSAPLITAASGAVLDLTAGGTLTATTGGAAPAATGTIATLGATIGLTATDIETSTSIALPSGKLTMSAADAIQLNPGTAIDLSGRDVPLFDQTAYSTGGTLALNAGAGGITQAAGASIDVSAPGAAAGSVSAISPAGTVSFDGTLRGTAAAGLPGGSFAISALSLPDFDALNTALDAGGFTQARDFEAASGDITIDQTVTAHTVNIAADAGAVTVTGTIDASGSAPGSIGLFAGTTLTLAGSAVLEAQSSHLATDSYGNPIDAENTAHVSLSSLSDPAGTSVTGSVVLMPGAAIDVANQGTALGQIDISAPRAGTDGVAVTAAGPLDISGAATITVNAFAAYSPKDALGTIVQDNGTGNTAGQPYSAYSAAGTLGIDQIGLDNDAYMAMADANGAALAAQLSGLNATAGVLHLRPGVLIESSAATNGDLTISGDIDLSRLRTSDPAQFGQVRDPRVDGSGEPGTIVFRAANDLTINGSVTDGFARPPDETNGTPLEADRNGWTYQQIGRTGEVSNADVLLPESAVAEDKGKPVSGQIVLLGSMRDHADASVFYNGRPISLNYAIVINPNSVEANVVIPFNLTVGAATAPIPAGGWVATAPILNAQGGVIFARGQFIPANTVFQTGDVFQSGTVLPISVQTGVDASGTGQTVPAGTPLNIFTANLSLSQDTGVLPVNALLPAGTYAAFGAVVDGSVVAADGLDLRSKQKIAGNMVEGYLYPLAPLLPAGTQSWSMDFVAGANLAGADVQAVQPLPALLGGVFTPPPAMTNQAPGSILLDDQHYYTDVSNHEHLDGSKPPLAFSVIRTGTGSLSLVAGGDIDQSSLYGIYTAGTEVPLAQGLNHQFDTNRQPYGRGNLFKLGRNQAAGVLIEQTYQAYYPNGGGDVLFAAQGDVTGDLAATTATGANADGTPASDAIGNWLWRQGSTQLGQPTAWWINFGTLVQPLGPQGALSSLPVQMVGFQGIGALGGGNVTVDIGGNAGQSTARGIRSGHAIQRGEGLVVAVGSTGRLLPGASTPVETGGGDISVTIGGTLNPLDAAAYGIGASASATGGQSPAVNGDIIDVRGNITVTAGAVGRIDPIYNAAGVLLGDPRAQDPFSSEDGVPNGGIEVAPGDGTVSISTLRDLVLAGAADPGRVVEQSYTRLNTYGGALKGYFDQGGDTGFTLWQAGTGISLFSEGGSVTPTTVPNTQPAALTFANDAPTDFRSIYPPNLFVTAATGDIVYGQYGVSPASTVALGSASSAAESLETMPAPQGQISFLAGTSIFANFYAVDLSGANPAGLSLPANPAFNSNASNLGGLTNISGGAETNFTPTALFALEADTPTTNLHADDPAPARFYAAGGDILDFQTGETLSFIKNGSLETTWYIAAKPVWIIAGQDIVSSGTRPAADPDAAVFAVQENQAELGTLADGSGEYSSGNLFLNTGANAISLISAGRDILSTYAYVGGPGLLQVQAGRNLYQASVLNAGGQLLDFGSFKSLGDDLIAGSPFSLTSGAGIAVLAGVGAAGPDYTAFAELYFNPDNQANLALPLTDPANKGKVQQVYATQLAAWLAANDGYTGDAGGALAAFLALPAIEQGVFVRQVYFEELDASGAQESNPASRFFGSYDRGRVAIDTLFPSDDHGTGTPVGYTGGITMYSGTVLNAPTASATPLTAPGGGNAVFDGGVATLFGGNVQVLDPGGEAIFGVPGGPAPGNSSGIVTYGSGAIDSYSLGSVLLGKSRLFTTAGGDILIWSSDGDINAGIGAKTTQVFNPPVLVYDDVGDITDTPPAVTTGAGIATLQPLADVPAGDISLVAPQGTIDAGEAGIRVSGNLVLAASRVVGTANIQVKGSTQGAPTVTVASLGAVEAAGSAAGAAANTAQSQGQRGAENNQPQSVLDVEVVSIGGTYDEERKRRHAP